MVGISNPIKVNSEVDPSFMLFPTPTVLHDIIKVTTTAMDKRHDIKHSRVLQDLGFRDFKG